MKVRDLERPVKVAKVDWLPGTTWLGFSPQGNGSEARQKCESSINRQIGGGLVLEKVTKGFGAPNRAFRDDPRIAEERELHRQLSDRLTAIHQVISVHRYLRDFVGDKEFDWLQDVWDDGDRKRWSVSFPIIRTWKFVDKPLAHQVLPEKDYRRLGTQTASLHRLSDEAIEALAVLELHEPIEPNPELLTEMDDLFAEATEISDLDRLNLLYDLEGSRHDLSVKARRRSAMLVRSFINERRASGKLQCDKCSFDPSATHLVPASMARSCLDVHHRVPLSGGERLTTIDDLELLCPTCHRIVHLTEGRKDSAMTFAKIGDMKS